MGKNRAWKETEHESQWSRYPINIVRMIEYAQTKLRERPYMLTT